MPSRPPTHHSSRPKIRPREHRDSACKRGYDRHWREAAAGHLHENPLCARCLASGLTTSAEVVDHITPHKGDVELFWNRDNWQSLCKPCHDRKTVAEDGGLGQPLAPQQPSPGDHGEDAGRGVRKSGV